MKKWRYNSTYAQPREWMEASFLLEVEAGLTRETAKALDGHQGRSERDGKELKILDPPQIKPRFHRCPVRLKRYINFVLKCNRLQTVGT
jgi:hypothetical protein